MFEEIRNKTFANGIVYALKTKDGFPLEVTDTFLPFYTKNAINDNTNKLKDNFLGSREERYIIGVSVMSGCPVRCQFCATGNMPKFRNLSSDEIVSQIDFIINKNKINPKDSKEFKINYTRMGEPFLNLENVKKAIKAVDEKFKDIRVHHYISSIGIKNSDFSWIRDNVTLQISLHSLDEERRNRLIPYKNKMSIKELGEIRTNSSLKTTLNLTLVDEKDFDIDKIKENFDKNYFFIKLSPINENNYSIKNNLGTGIIQSENII